jgi:hypothetical protein
MMFKFYQPQKKEQEMTAKLWRQIAYEAFLEGSGTSGPKWQDLPGADHRGWGSVLNAVCQLEKEATTPPDPALLLAQRIASISAETGLKPRHVLSIVNQIRWEKEDEAFEARPAAAPQENQPDATDPAMVYAARIKAVMDLLGCDVNTARSVVINAEYSAKKAVDNA